ncbi:MAG: nodulation protein NfeD [Actinomycetota bacterium]|nr:nodulation protein NfeD [Actinomycetota bacterium]
MKIPLLRAFLVLAAGVSLVLAFALPSAAESGKRVLAISFDNDVNPVTADYVTQQLDRANDDDYSAAVIVLDTPGGLSSSMEKIYKKELASRIPVVVYIAPNGAGAASAGVFIAQAADVLAMAPGTSIGASTPIGQGGGNLPSDERRKAIKFFAAKLRALAGTHGRNVRWADRAVRVADSLTAHEALRKNVVDAVAPNLPALLRQLDGYKTKPRRIELHLAGARIDTVHLSGWKRILDTIIDPNIIVLLMSVGVLGIIVELWNPGLIFPGTVGAISLILGLFGLSVLPVSWAGILLMLLAAGFFGAEPFLPSHGALALAGAVSFVFGTLLLFDPAGPAYEVSLPVVLAIAGTLTLFMAFAVAKIVQVRRRPVTVGVHTLVGERGVVRRDGYLLVHGERWRAHARNGEPLEPGQEVQVEAVEDGFTLAVRPVPPDAQPAQPTA